MDFESFQTLVKEVGFGKQLPEAIYLHQQAMGELPIELEQLIVRITKALKITRKSWDVLKLYKRDFKISLLSYPSFFEEPYPALQRSYTIDLAKLSVREADYKKSENPPILHRRETFFRDDHPQHEYFHAFTLEGEAIGLYENTRTIGFLQSWQRLIKKKGYFLDSNGHLKELLEKPPPKPEHTGTGPIDRHKTALSRDRLSLPMFLIAQRGYLDGRYSVLDYGCGKGDDLRELNAHGIDCIGWDPIYAPDVDIYQSDIVNLGYVINVIEDQSERRETLKRAYEHTNRLLLVSAMLGNERIYEKFAAYKDGVITSKNTFQKYYFQEELRQYIQSALEEDPIPIAPGIFIVFKDKIEEQRYLIDRQKTKYNWRQLTSLPKPRKSRRAIKSKFEKNKQIFEDFWYTCLDLGRVPSNQEFEFSDQIRHVMGSHNKAFEICCEEYGREDFDSAKNKRYEDLMVYFGLSYFRKRKYYSRMPGSLKLDIKAFFSSYTDARKISQDLLHSLADPEVIYDACIRAHKKLPTSQLNGQHDLIFHKRYLNDCPPELRIYVACATLLYGELDNVSLIKTHILSGKVTFLVYDDWKKEKPLLVERIKVDLTRQETTFFDYYPPYEPQELNDKHLFL